MSGEAVFQLMLNISLPCPTTTNTAILPSTDIVDSSTILRTTRSSTNDLRPFPLSRQKKSPIATSHHDRGFSYNKHHSPLAGNLVMQRRRPSNSIGLIFLRFRPLAGIKVMHAGMERVFGPERTRVSVPLRGLR